MSLAEIYPKDSVLLRSFEDGSIIGTIRIKNFCKCKIAFKVKANNKNKYEVSPAQGVLLGESQGTVEIQLKPQGSKGAFYMGFDKNKEISSIEKDKFMISVVKMEGFPDVNK